MESIQDEIDLLRNCFKLTLAPKSFVNLENYNFLPNELVMYMNESFPLI
mgnify:CR=1 FL=1